MKKTLFSLLSLILCLSFSGCTMFVSLPNDTENAPDIPKITVDGETEEQLLSFDNYDEFLDDIYLCDDVYRSDETPVHGTGSILLPMPYDDLLEVKDYDILLCGDYCAYEAVVSRASQGYAPAYRVVLDGEIDGNFKTLKFKMEIPEGMLEDIKKQGVYDQIVEEIESQYYYLLVLDERHYAYINLGIKDGAERSGNESEIADAIVKNAMVSFEPNDEKIDLTIERVIRLSERGDELTWADFDMYEGSDIGSGLHIFKYNIDDDFYLEVGSFPTKKPSSIDLVSRADIHNKIDIRTEDVERFISENREEESATETALLWVGMDASELPGLPWDDAWVDHDSGVVWLKKSFAEYDSDFLLMIDCDEAALPAYDNAEQWEEAYINSPYGTVMEIHQSEIDSAEFCGYPKASYFTPITLETITKNDVNENEHHVFVKEESEYTQYLLLEPSEELSDISLSLMELTDAGYAVGEKLYMLDKLNTDKPLVVGIVFYGDLTTYGLSFRNSLGKEYNYVIYTSGKDGSVILQSEEQ